MCKRLLWKPVVPCNFYYTRRYGQSKPFVIRYRHMKCILSSLTYAWRKQWYTIWKSNGGSVPSPACLPSSPMVLRLWFSLPWWRFWCRGIAGSAEYYLLDGSWSNLLGGYLLLLLYRNIVRPKQFALWTIQYEMSCITPSCARAIPIFISPTPANISPGWPMMWSN